MGWWWVVEAGAAWQVVGWIAVHGHLHTHVHIVHIVHVVHAVHAVHPWSMAQQTLVD